MAPTLPRHLARHLGVAGSTLSAALNRLSALGYLTREPARQDRRQIELRLTAAGTKAMSAASVLDPRRVARMLGQLPESKRRRAVAGLQALADAALAGQATAPRRKRW